MSDATTEVKDAATTVTTPLETPEQEDTTSFAERYSDVLGKVNDTLDQVDWSQMGRIGKIVGIFAAVIIAQIVCWNCSAWSWWANGAGRTSPPATSAMPWFSVFKPSVRSPWAEPQSRRARSLRLARHWLR